MAEKAVLMGTLRDFPWKRSFTEPFPLMCWGLILYGLLGILEFILKACS
jgi:hypothetical protein